jgi:AcrR family transcriptional regulator
MTTAMGRRERNNLERRANLLAVARRLFDVQGFEETTVEQIAAEAGLATRTVYNFFPFKVDLVAALLSEEIRERMPPGPAGGQDDRGSAYEGLLALITRQIEIMASLPKTEQKQVVARSLLAGSASEASRYNAEIDVFIRGTITEFLAGRSACGALPPDLDPEVTAGLVFSMLNGLYLEWLQSDTDLQAVLPAVAGYLRLILRP